MTLWELPIATALQMAYDPAVLASVVGGSTVLHMLHCKVGLPTSEALPGLAFSTA